MNRSYLAIPLCLLLLLLAATQLDGQPALSRSFAYHASDDPAWALEDFDDRDWMRMETGSFPHEAWNDIELPEPVPIRAADPDTFVIQVHRYAYRSDPALPIVSIRTDRRKEPA